MERVSTTMTRLELLTDHMVQAIASDPLGQATIRSCRDAVNTEVNNVRLLIQQKLNLLAISHQPMAVDFSEDRTSCPRRVRTSSSISEASLSVQDVKALWTLCQIECVQLDRLCGADWSGIHPTPSTGLCIQLRSHLSSDGLSLLFQKWIKLREEWSTKCDRLHQILTTKWHPAGEYDDSNELDDGEGIGLAYPDAPVDKLPITFHSLSSENRKHQLEAYLQDCEQGAFVCDHLTRLLMQIRPNCTPDGLELMTKQIEDFYTALGARVMRSELELFQLTDCSAMENWIIREQFIVRRRLSTIRAHSPVLVASNEVRVRVGSIFDLPACVLLRHSTQKYRNSLTHSGSIYINL
ncbi:unnamed protein product [Echinostoma caproni]|uniref:Uncharacterized protein n=1 Tax=Echinostoma caproni TaxID=27848 RepID=A0A183AUG3_9TREM|nr:unnamed protein product [Echinostoma caproni]